MTDIKKGGPTDEIPPSPFVSAVRAEVHILIAPEEKFN